MRASASVELPADTGFSVTEDCTRTVGFESKPVLDARGPAAKVRATKSAELEMRVTAD
jgi:hypothetical protein